MKRVLICGAGQVARDLLMRLGDSWDIDLIENDPDKLQQTSDMYPFFKKTHQGDASSLVVLEEAGLAGYDYVLALTNRDQINLAVAKFAVEKGIKYILARVNDAAVQPEFEALGVRTLTTNTLAAKAIFHYLVDSRFSVTPLTLGNGEAIEIEVGPRSWLVGRRSSSLNEVNCRLAAIFRDREMVFPSARTRIKAGDRLVLLAQPQTFEAISRLFDSGRLQFPLSYGRELLAGLLPRKGADQNRILQECIGLVQNTGLRGLQVVCAEDKCEIASNIDNIAQGVDAGLEVTGDDVWDQIYEQAREKSVGLVVIPPLETGFFQSLVKPRLITLAHSLPCPLFVARGTQPYERILVPFTATPMSEVAIEAGIDLARHYEGTVTAVAVEEPEIIHGDQDDEWAETIFRRVRELSHANKHPIEEIVREGNPVKVIVELAADFDLIILGSTTKDTGLFTPHVGELLASRTPCSAMIITS